MKTSVWNLRILHKYDDKLEIIKDAKELKLL